MISVRVLEIRAYAKLGEFKVAFVGLVVCILRARSLRKFNKDRIRRRGVFETSELDLKIESAACTHV